mgnify:CR=1 FL=1
MSDEWWGCLIDYPSFWPWAGRHRPCFGIGIYCFQSEPIPVIHLKGILVSCIKELWVELMLVYMPFKRYMIFICGMNGVLPQSVICPIVKYNGSSRSYPTLHEKRTTLWYGSMTPGCPDYIYTLDSWLAILNFFINAYQQVLWALTLFNKTRRWVYWSGNKHHYTLKYLIDHQEKQQILHYSAKIPLIHRSFSKSDCRLYYEI